MKPSYRLFYAPDNASLIIRLVLEELQLAYETHLVDRTVSAQKSPEYLAVNPSGKIPALETPDGILSEVGAILLYLSETHQALAPKSGEKDRPAFLKWLFFISNTLHPDLIMQFYLHRYGPEDTLPEMRKRTSARLQAHLGLLDELAGSSSILGADRLSVLDYYVATCLRWSALYPQGETGWFDLTDYPALHALCERLEHRAAVRAAIDAEGLGPTPFSMPHYACPPEGAAL